MNIIVRGMISNQFSVSLSCRKTYSPLLNICKMWIDKNIYIHIGIFLLNRSYRCEPILTKKDFWLKTMNQIDARLSRFQYKITTDCFKVPNCVISWSFLVHCSVIRSQYLMLKSLRWRTCYKWHLARAKIDSDAVNELPMTHCITPSATTFCQISLAIFMTPSGL